MLFLAIVVQPAFGSQEDSKWGGPGYDPALKKRNSHRFLAQEHFKNDTMIDIWVDSKETVKEVGRMDLISSDKTKLSSNRCYKAMRHITAPWSCAFQKNKFQEISGEGTIHVFDRSNKLLIKNSINFDVINKKFGHVQKSNSLQNELFVPEKVGIYFIPSPKRNKLPSLELTVFAGNGCDKAGELQITKKLILNQPNIYTKGGIIDILEVQIKGYEFQDAPQKTDISCPAVIIESRATIELNEIMTNQELQLKIVLNDQINTLGLNQHEDIIYLDPIGYSQIISWDPGENMPDRPQGLGFMTETFQEHLAKVRLNGSYAHKSNLATRLRDYIRNAGYEPLDEKLQGYPQMNPLEEFIVFVPSTKELPENFEIIGKVPYQEIPGGEKLIDVGLIKAQNINPFFVRY